MYFKRFKNISLVFSVLITISCVSTKPYVKPEGEDISKINFINEWGLDNFHMLKERGLEYKSKRRLEVSIYKTKCGEFGGFYVDEPDFVKTNYVSAGKRLFIFTRGHLINYRSPWVGPAFHANDATCDLNISFIPELDMEYDLKYWQHGNKCFVKINKLTSVGNVVRREKDRTFKREAMCKEAPIYHHFEPDKDETS